VGYAKRKNKSMLKSMVWTYASPRKKQERKEKDSPHPKSQKQKKESYTKKEFIHKDHALAHFDQDCMTCFPLDLVFDLET
jgi:hypothetical protein